MSNTAIAHNVGQAGIVFSVVDFALFDLIA